MPGRPAMHRTSTVLWTLVVPLGVLAAAVALAFAWRDRLPDPIATHWGQDGVDGTGSFGATVGLMAGIVVPFTAGAALVGLLAGRTAAVRRAAAFVGVWFAAAMCGLIAGSLAIQRGVADAHDVGGLGPVMAVAFGVLALVALMLRWTVTVDRDGLTARGALPRPRTRIPLDEVLSAEVVRVDPLREFGGWGYRLGPGGRVGIVLRAGDAILVRRTGGRELVVTVDDAARGAALLNTLAERSR